MNLLGRFEGKREVCASVLGSQFAEVECVWVEVMNKRTERKTVCPRRRKVGYVHQLQQTRAILTAEHLLASCPTHRLRPTCIVKINILNFE